MKRRLHIPELNPVIVDLALVLATSFMMSVVFITTVYMVYVQLRGS